MTATSPSPILVLDFGSQLTQLIARKLREQNFYSEVHRFDLSIEKIRELKPVGIILSGGPNSVYEAGSPIRDVKELLEIAPLLGICYGMQLLSYQLGGKVERAQSREYGFNVIQWKKKLGQIPLQQKVWMSHGDIVERPPQVCEVIAQSESGHTAAFLGEKILGLQFHPEVAHTEHGDALLRYFSETMCHAKPTWQAPQIVQQLQNEILKKVGSTDHVLVGLSGGVDSSVVATLLTKTLGPERVHCVFVNNGLLRKNEFAQVMADYKAIGLNVKAVDASKIFLEALKGHSDPEIKRKAIGRVFIEVFEAALDPKWPIKWLGQGTLYPDVIESVSFSGGPSHKIKSHHNVGGLPEKMKLKLVEPVRELFKDEVRRIGLELGLPKHMIARHPFPGPGLAIRVMGEVNEKSLKILREADAIFIQKLKDKGLYDKIWQAAPHSGPTGAAGGRNSTTKRPKNGIFERRRLRFRQPLDSPWQPFQSGTSS